MISFLGRESIQPFITEKNDIKNVDSYLLGNEEPQ